MPRVRQYPEETPIAALERRVAILEGIIRERFLEGAGQIDAGNTTEVITHGLSVAPSSVFVAQQGTTTDPLWVTAIGATTFTVNRGGTSGNLGFFWLAIP